MTRTLVHGAGRMARRVVAHLQDFKDFELTGLVSRSQPEEDFGVNWFGSLNDIDTPVDLLIDFTLPGGDQGSAGGVPATDAQTSSTA